MSQLKIALGGAAVMALVLVFAAGRAPAPVVPANTSVAKDEPDSRFGGRFDGEQVVVGQDKADMEKPAIRNIPIERDPKPVVTEHITPVAPPVLAAKAKEEDEEEQPSSRRRERAARRRHDGLCERHGMRKVITRGGRSWRCRR